MGLKYYSNEFKDSKKISDIDMPIYTNENKYLSPTDTYTSLRNYHGIHYPLKTNIYANISKLPSDLSNDTSYATLVNTTSMNCPIVDENNRIYENLKLNNTSSSSASSSPSPIYMNLNDHGERSPPLRETNQEEEIEMNVLEKCPTTKTKQTVKIPRVPSSVRQRRTLHRPRRYRRRSSTPFRAITNSNVTRRHQQQQQHSNPSIHHPMTSNIRRKRSAQKSATNHLYNQAEAPIICLSEDIFAYPIQFHQLLSSQPIENSSKELVQQTFSTPENGESVVQQNQPNNEEDEEEEEEEELCPHDTFEDFFLRRRPKSSCSTLASVTNTILSSESFSSEVPPRPPLPPPVNQRSPGSGVALSLDKKDVDFIHDILQRSQGDQRVSNRIAALKEAYLRAADKRSDLLKTMKIPQDKKKSTIKPSIIASKIRDELEKYDELPAHRKSISPNDDYDDADYDETYSTNVNYRYHYHRRLPSPPSTADRIINFMVSLKRQLQKNFQEFRSRILIEAKSNHRHKHTFRPASGPPSRRPKTSQAILPRSSSHYSMEHSYPFNRQESSRTHSDISHIPPSSFDKHVSRRPRTFRVTPHQQQQQRRRRRIS